MPVAPMIALFSGVAIAVFNPLGTVGDAWIGTGGGDLINGSVALVLMVIGAIWAAIVVRRSKGAK